MKRYRIVRNDDDERYELPSTNCLQTARKRASKGNFQWINKFYRVFDTVKNCFV